MQHHHKDMSIFHDVLLSSFILRSCSLKSRSVGVWKGNRVGGPLSRGLEKQYLSYTQNSNNNAPKGKKVWEKSSKRTSISNIFKPQTCTCEFQIAESEEQIKEKKIRQESLNWNRRIKREIMDEKARQSRRDVRTERLKRQRREK